MPVSYTTPMPTDKNTGKRAGEGEGKGESQTGEKTKNNRKQPDCHSSIGAQPQQLNGCVVEIKLKVDFDDRCCPSKWASPREAGGWKGKIFPVLYSPVPHLFQFDLPVTHIPVHSSVAVIR